MQRKRIILLGATGSIGTSTMEVVSNCPEEMDLVALAAHRRWQQLFELAVRTRPHAVALGCPEAAASFQSRATAEGLRSRSGGPLPVYSGADGIVRLVEEVDAEIVLGAISGAAGLPTSLAALRTGKDLALANKESLVTSGALLMREAKERGRQILPVDSEHSAIFQSLLAGRADEVESIILTASGGPFRESSPAELAAVTKEQALRHPTWDMGAKITIDSATLMNKALEVIEARWLFELEGPKIKVVVHPQSIIHSIVQFVDGSMVCQLGPPDMKIPIQYALTYPSRRPLPIERLDLADVGRFTFFRPDTDRFPALRMVYDVLEKAGTAPTSFNAANEVAVSAFLEDELSFPGISTVVERTLEQHALERSQEDSEPSLDDVLSVDSWSRDEARRQIKKLETQAG